MSTNPLTSTVVSALATTNIIVSLSSPAERRRLAVEISAHEVAQGQVVVCVSNDPSWAAEVRFALNENGIAWTRKVKRTFIHMSRFEFRQRSRYGLGRIRSNLVMLV